MEVLRGAQLIPPGSEILEFYYIKPPYVAAVVYKDPSGVMSYRAIEPVLTGPEANLFVRLKDLLLLELELSIEETRAHPEEASRKLRRALAGIVRRYGIRVTRESLGKILYYLERDIIYYGPIDPLYWDPRVEDITCDGVGLPVYVFHRNYAWLRTNIVFKSVEALTAFARRLAYKAGQDINYAKPITEGPLPPRNFRAHLTLDPVSRRGATFTIRRASDEPFTIVDLLRFNTISSEAAAFLWQLIHYKVSMLVVGPMASGKTTFLNALAMLIPPEAKIVTIEETPEIRLLHENWVPLTVRPSFEPGVQDVTLFDLLKSSLRQRPDYIIVGEIRGEEANTFFQAIAVGHGGLGTFHAENPEQTLRRLMTPPISIPRSMIPLLKIIIVMARFLTPAGLRRRTLKVTEVVDFPEEDRIGLSDIYVYDPANDVLGRASRGRVVEYVSEKEGISVGELEEDLRRRKAVLEWMKLKRIQSPPEVMKVVRSYYLDPVETYERAERELREEGVSV